MARRKMPSVMKNRFSEVPAANIRRSVFDRSHGHKTTFDAGYLVPIFLDEVLPGDTFSMKHSFICRMATPIFPVMDNLFLDIHYFFVPNRLIWTDWEEFCGNAEYYDPKSMNSWPIARPYFAPWVAAYSKDRESAYKVVSGSLADYLGVPIGLEFPTQVSGNDSLPINTFVSAFPFLAYNQIYNEWYRDENLIPPLDKQSLIAGTAVVDRQPKDQTNYLLYDTEHTNSADDSDSMRPEQPFGTGYVGRLFKRGKRHDYFTSCLPWPSKGPSVTLPLSGEVPVKGLGVYTDKAIFPDSSYFPNRSGSGFTAAGKVSYYSNPLWVDYQQGNNSNMSMFIEGKQPVGQSYYIPNVRVDLGTASAVSINELRQAFQVQKLYERDARGGTRYIEILRSHFGVTSPDARLQRPEYLGGSSNPIHIAPIPQTSATSSNSPQGNLSAYAIANGTKRCFTKSFVEHGIVIGIASIRADLTYQDGLDRMWSRKSRFDYYWPTLAHLGEQAVLNQEIYFDTTANSTKNEQVFGYQERFAEYRYKNSLITGGMRSKADNSYSAWHLGQSYTTTPALNQSFIEENPPMERILALGASTKGRQFIFDGYFNLKCTRPMPVYSVPGLVDHF